MTYKLSYHCPETLELLQRAALEAMSYGDYVEQLTSLLAAEPGERFDVVLAKIDSSVDSDNPPPPDVIAQEIVVDLEAALEQFRLIAGDLESSEAGLAA